MKDLCIEDLAYLFVETMSTINSSRNIQKWITPGALNSCRKMLWRIFVFPKNMSRRSETIFDYVGLHRQNVIGQISPFRRFTMKEEKRTKDKPYFRRFHENKNHSFLQKLSRCAKQSFRDQCECDHVLWSAESFWLLRRRSKYFVLREEHHQATR